MFFIAPRKSVQKRRRTKMPNNKLDWENWYITNGIQLQHVVDSSSEPFTKTGFVGFNYQELNLSTHSLNTCISKINQFIKELGIGEEDVRDLRIMREKAGLSILNLNTKILLSSTVFSALCCINHPPVNPYANPPYRNDDKTTYTTHHLKQEELEHNFAKHGLDGWWSADACCRPECFPDDVTIVQDYVENHEDFKTTDKVDDLWFVMHDNYNTAQDEDWRSSHTRYDWYFARRSKMRNLEGKYNIEVTHIGLKHKRYLGVYDLEVTLYLDTTVQMLRSRGMMPIDHIFDLSLGKFKPMLGAGFGFNNPKIDYAPQGCHQPRITPYWWELKGEFYIRGLKSYVGSKNMFDKALCKIINDWQSCKDVYEHVTGIEVDESGRKSYTISLQPAPSEKGEWLPQFMKGLYEWHRCYTSDQLNNPKPNTPEWFCRHAVRQILHSIFGEEIW